MTKFPSKAKPRKFDVIQSIVIYKEGFTCKALEFSQAITYILQLNETYEQNVTKFPSNTKPRKFDIIQSLL